MKLLCQKTTGSFSTARTTLLSIVTGLEPGSIPPFGSLFALKTYCDERLAEEQTINFSAGDHAKSVSMTYADFLKVEEPVIGVFAE